MNSLENGQSYVVCTSPKQKNALPKGARLVLGDEASRQVSWSDAGGAPRGSVPRAADGQARGRPADRSALLGVVAGGFGAWRPDSLWMFGQKSQVHRGGSSLNPRDFSVARGFQSEKGGPCRGRGLLHPRGSRRQGSSSPGRFWSLRSGGLWVCTSVGRLFVAVAHVLWIVCLFVVLL